MIRSSSSSEQEKAKEDEKNREPEQELEVPSYHLCRADSFSTRSNSSVEQYRCTSHRVLKPSQPVRRVSSDVCSGVGEPGGGSWRVSGQQGPRGARVHDAVWYRRPLHPNRCQRGVGAEHSEHPGELTRSYRVPAKSNLR